MAMVNDSTNSMRTSAISDVHIVLFTFQHTSDRLFAKLIPIGYLQSSDPRSHYIRMLALTCLLVEYFASPTPDLRLIRAVWFLLYCFAGFGQRSTQV